MIKIGPKVLRNIERYSRKNTVFGQYKRYKFGAKISAVMTGIEVARFSSWGIPDIGLTSLFCSAMMHNGHKAIELYKKLGPIKQRAKSIYKYK